MRVKLKRTILYLNLLNVIVFYLIYISFKIVDSIVEIVKDEKDVLQGIHYQKKIVQEMFSNFPELLLIDATYKLNDLRMPLYIMMVVDGNGESEIVALWIVASEDRISIKNMVRIFKRHNSTDRTACIMSDKDMTERDVLSEEIPNAVLQICLFHTLRSFKREISTEKK